MPTIIPTTCRMPLRRRIGVRGCASYVRATPASFRSVHGGEARTFSQDWRNSATGKPSEGRGHRFESCRVHHVFKDLWRPLSLSMEWVWKMRGGLHSLVTQLEPKCAVGRMRASPRGICGRTLSTSPSTFATSFDSCTRCPESRSGTHRPTSDLLDPVHPLAVDTGPLFAALGAFRDKQGQKPLEDAGDHGFVPMNTFSPRSMR